MISERVSPILARCENSLTLETSLHAGVIAALEAEGEDRAGALGHVFFRELVVAVAGQPRIAHPRHLAMLGEPLRHRQRVVAVPLHAQRQRLDAGKDEEGIERRQRRSHVAQGQHAASDGESKIAESLVQHDAVIFRPWLAQHRIAFFARPVEGAAVDDQPADRVAVAAEKFGQRMHDDVGAIIDRLAEIGRGQRVIDDQRHACVLRDLGDRLDVGDDAARIGDRLDEDRLGFRTDRALEGARCRRVRPIPRSSRNS